MWQQQLLRIARWIWPVEQQQAGWLRDRIAVAAGVFTLLALVVTFLLSHGTATLMPGALSSGHAAIKNCSACHTQNGEGKLSWLHGLIAGDPLSDSKACLSCHKMPDVAFNAHSASQEVLQRSTKWLSATAAATNVPHAARIQEAAFPMDDVMAGGLFCATCHQEHKGTTFNLKRISNEQCRSCHVVRFDSFAADHPQFESFPFARRTRIIFDHGGHFSKHYPETAKKDPKRRVPENCSDCHNSNADRRVMAVEPFDRTCTSCHLDQIVGNERASGPKGIAFLALPGLDLQTLRQKKAAIGEWPDDSEAPLTPFMKLMIGRDKNGRELLDLIEKLDLKDLSSADESQIKAVTKLAWEIKGLYYALVRNKSSDALAALKVGAKSKDSATLLADLTASLPRDVVAAAQKEWLPRLASEMALGPEAGADELNALVAAVPDSEAAAAFDEAVVEVEQVPETEPSEAAPEGENGSVPAAANASDVCKEDAPAPGKLDSEAPSQETSVGEPPVQAENAIRESDEKLSLYEDDVTEVAGRITLPSGTPRAQKTRISGAGAQASQEDQAPDLANGDSGDETCIDSPSDSQSAGNPDANAARASADTQTPAGEHEGGEAPAPEVAGGTGDDLLFPTEEELRANSLTPYDAEISLEEEEIAAGIKFKKTTPATRTRQPGKGGAADQVQTAATPASTAGVESEVDPETWADIGGWYRQDFGIYYRPAGHKDKFIYSWLVLTSPFAGKGTTGPAAAVFAALTQKDAQGSCTKCHSIDDLGTRRKLVNFKPISLADKRGRFTNFVHEPHFSVIDKRGCLACHALERKRNYLKGYEQGDPRTFVKEFTNMDKKLCQACHTTGVARQDCLLCHKYHLNGAATPILSTGNTAQ